MEAPSGAFAIFWLFWVEELNDLEGHVKKPFSFSSYRRQWAKVQRVADRRKAQLEAKLERGKIDPADYQKQCAVLDSWMAPWRSL